jgi:uncharacterized protein YggE
MTSTHLSPPPLRAARCAFPLVLLLGLPWSLAASPLRAGTIEVEGSGVADADVVALVFRFRLVVDDETAAVAARAFLHARERVEKAFAELGIAELTVRGGGIQVAAMQESTEPFGGMVVVNGRPQEPPMREFVRWSESIEVRLPLDATAAAEQLFERIGVLVDVADEVGLAAAEPSTILPNAWMLQGLPGNVPRCVFEVEIADPDGTRRAAELLAVEAARRQATRLAEATGVALAEPLSIRVAHTAPLALVGDTRIRARQEIGLTIVFATR